MLVARSTPRTQAGVFGYGCVSCLQRPVGAGPPLAARRAAAWYSPAVATAPSRLWRGDRPSSPLARLDSLIGTILAATLHASDLTLGR